jgi:hypothetical protein
MTGNLEVKSLIYLSSSKKYLRNSVSFYAIGILGVREDQVDHVVDMKYRERMEIHSSNLILGDKDERK